MKFTVTIPAYKARYLQEAIDSVLAQTFVNFELIIVNDASPENLDSIVSNYTDSRIRYYKNKKNYGAIHVVDNWNKCLSYVMGDYIICMGDDDKLLPNCLDEYSQLISKYPNLDVFHGWTEIINERSEIINILDTRPDWESVYSLIWQRWAVRQQFIGDFLFKTSTLRENGGFYKLPLGWGSDDLTAYINAEKNGIANTQIPVFQYRQTGITISSVSNGLIKIDALKSERKWIEAFLKRLVPKSQLDRRLKYLLESNIDNRFNKRYQDTITKDIRNSRNKVFRISYWIRRFGQLDIDRKYFTKAILKGLLSLF